MKRRTKPSRCGVMYPHKIECAMRAAAHAINAAAQLVEFLLDQQRPDMAPDVDRIKEAANELAAARDWAASAKKPPGGEGT